MMTDEELERKSDEYVTSTGNNDCTCDAYEQGYKDGYIAGAKENGVQWHDLRNNPEDLPSDVGWVSNQDGLPCYYEWATERWLNCRDIEIKVTAWCDMPSLGEDFSEEEE